MIWTVIAIAIVYVLFGGIGLSSLPQGTSLADPAAWCMILFGLSAAVMLAAGVRTRLRFKRNGAAVLSDAWRVVIAFDRVRSGLFAAALALAEPQLILKLLIPTRSYSGHTAYPVYGLMAFPVAYFAVQALRRALKPAVLAVLDAEGIEAPQIWLGRIRWRDLEDIRVDSTESTVRVRMRMKCLALVFREGLSTPQRTGRNRPFEAHAGLGIFLFMPSWLGLTFDDAVSGLNGWLERSRG